MKKPTPCPCDKCSKAKDCMGTCSKWIKWLFSPDSEEKYRQETLK